MIYYEDIKVDFDLVSGVWCRRVCGAGSGGLRPGPSLGQWKLQRGAAATAVLQLQLPGPSCSCDGHHPPHAAWSPCAAEHVACRRNDSSEVQTLAYVSYAIK